MRRLLVNDALSQLGERTFWHMLQEWFGCEFVGIPFNKSYGVKIILPPVWDKSQRAIVPDVIIRNATYLPPFGTSAPTISILQDIIPSGPLREMQAAVIKSSARTVYNSRFTAAQYAAYSGYTDENPGTVIPLPVDFSLFTPQNAMGCQQALGLPDGCVCWIGASLNSAGAIKGFDILLQLARLNPDINFVCVFKDEVPLSFPPNMRCYARLPQAELVKVIGACRVGLCTSRTESQHLAGIEMGACGLPVVAPPVGVYWKMKPDAPVVIVDSPAAFAEAIRLALSRRGDGRFYSSDVREYWRREFDIPVVRAQWEKLVAEVENVR